MRSVKRLVMMMALLGLSAALGAAEGPAPLRRERTIPLPGVSGRIDHLSVDAKHHRLYVAALGNDTVEVIDLVGGARVGTVRGLAEPQGVLALPDEGRLLVANRRDGTLRILDSGGLATLVTVRLGGDADNLRRDASGRVWVGWGDGTLTAVDAAGQRLAEVPLGAHPESFQLERGGRRLFVNLPDRHQVAVVDRDRARVIASWGTDGAAANFPMALDEADQRLFVVCRRPARLLALDTASGRRAGELPTVGDADDVFYDAATRRLYVSGGEGAIAVIRQLDPDHYQEIARLPTAPGARTSLFSAELGRLFLAVRQHGGLPAAVWEYATVP